MEVSAFIDCGRDLFLGTILTLYGRSRSFLRLGSLLPKTVSYFSFKLIVFQASRVSLVGRGTSFLFKIAL
jgi:hypothetical protein